MGKRETRDTNTRLRFYFFVLYNNSAMSTFISIAISQRNFKEGCVSLLQILERILGVFKTLLGKYL